MAGKKPAHGEKPDFIKGKVIHYPYGEYPKVKAGDDVYGYATAHAPTAVIVQWDDGERVHSEWFPARLVHRVNDEDWHGRWMPRQAIGHKGGASENVQYCSTWQSHSNKASRSS